MRPVVFSSRGAFALLVLVAGASSCEAPAFVRGSGAEGGPSEAGADGERESRGAGEMGASGGLSATSASAIPPETDTSYGGRPEPEVLPPGRRYGNGRSRDADSLGVLLAELECLCYESRVEKLAELSHATAGTSAPETIGYVTSSGCVRLTNWDAARLAGLIESDTEVEFRDIRRETPASDG